MAVGATVLWKPCSRLLLLEILEFKGWRRWRYCCQQRQFFREEGWEEFRALLVSVDWTSRQIVGSTHTTLQSGASMLTYTSDSGREESIFRIGPNINKNLPPVFAARAKGPVVWTMTNSPESHLDLPVSPLPSASRQRFHAQAFPPF